MFEVIPHFIAGQDGVQENEHLDQFADAVLRGWTPGNPGMGGASLVQRQE